jgi:hypothetical protein
MSRENTAASGPIKTIVTNVPGPQVPLYMVGSKVVGMFPFVPLLQGMDLGIALFSYNGEVFWGFNADYNLVPGLAYFVGTIETHPNPSSAPPTRAPGTAQRLGVRPFRGGRAGVGPRKGRTPSRGSRATGAAYNPKSQESPA